MLKKNAFTFSDSQAKTVETELSDQSDSDEDLTSFIFKNSAANSFSLTDSDNQSDEVKSTVISSFIQNLEVNFVLKKNNVVIEETKKNLHIQIKDFADDEMSASIKNMQSKVENASEKNDELIIIISDDNSSSFYKDDKADISTWAQTYAEI